MFFIYGIGWYDMMCNNDWCDDDGMNLQNLDFDLEVREVLISKISRRGASADIRGYFKIQIQLHIMLIILVQFAWCWKI